jgi:hypothetical protein
LQVLFKVLRTHGSLFSPSVWQIVFRGVLFPIFEDARRDEDGGSIQSQSSSSSPSTSNFVGKLSNSASSVLSGASSSPTVALPGAQVRKLSSSSGHGDHPDNDWVRTTCHAAMSTLIDLFAHFHSVVSFLLSDLLDLISSCIIQVFLF